METIIVLGLIGAASYWVIRTVKHQMQAGGSCACSGKCGNCPSQTTSNHQTVITRDDPHLLSQSEIDDGADRKP